MNTNTTLNAPSISTNTNATAPRGGRNQNRNRSRSPQAPFAQLARKRDVGILAPQARRAVARAEATQKWVASKPGYAELLAAQNPEDMAAFERGFVWASWFATNVENTTKFSAEDVASVQVGVSAIMSIADGINAHRPQRGPRRS